MKKLMICLLGLPLVLSGCAEMAARHAEFEAKIAAADNSQCRSYGAEQGTPVYVECRMMKAQQHAQETAVLQAAANRQFNCGVAMMSGAVSYCN